MMAFAQVPAPLAFQHNDSFMRTTRSDRRGEPTERARGIVCS